MRAILLTAICLTALSSSAFAQVGTAREREVVAPPTVVPVTPVVPMAPTAPATTAIPAPNTLPVSPEPQSTTATFGDWILRCQRVGDDARMQKSCEVAQSIQVQGQTAPVAQIAIGRRAPEESLRVTVLLPTNITLPSIVTIATDEKDQQPLQLTWHRCVPGGCFADAEILSDLLTRWRTLTEAGRITFQESTGRAIVIPLSFRGLASALDALSKS